MNTFKQPIEERFTVIVKEAAAVHHTTFEFLPFFLNFCRSDTAPHVQRISLKTWFTASFQVTFRANSEQLDNGSNDGAFTIVALKHFRDDERQGISGANVASQIPSTASSDDRISPVEIVKNLCNIIR
ncbi:hypothetical protein C8K58_11010 [Pseudomonas sp. GV047]|nr:hypothetical protein C8K58_11010 [Pseudomonas sp. GV047]